MISCKQVLHFVSDYIDNELSVSEKKEIDNHLRSCHSCAKLIEETLRSRKSLKNLKSKYITSEDFDYQLHNKIAVELAHPRNKFLLWLEHLPRKPIAGIAVVFILLIIGLSLGVFNKSINDYSGFQNQKTTIQESELKNNSPPQLSTQPSSSASVGSIPVSNIIPVSDSTEQLKKLVKSAQ